MHVAEGTTEKAGLNDSELPWNIDGGERFMYDTSMNSASATWYHVAASDESDTEQARAPWTLPWTPFSCAMSGCSFICLCSWCLSSYRLTSDRFWLVSREASPSYSCLSLNVDTDAAGLPLFAPRTHRDDVKLNGGEGLFLENRRGRAPAVDGMGSWQQFRCLLILCQLLRWTRVRSHRGPSPRFITTNKQRRHLACICDCGETRRYRHAVGFWRSGSGAPPKFYKSADLGAESFCRRLLGGCVSLWVRWPIGANVDWMYLHPEPNPWGGPPPPTHPQWWWSSCRP